jgi:hypothetical protein
METGGWLVVRAFLVPALLAIVKQLLLGRGNEIAVQDGGDCPNKFY